MLENSTIVDVNIEDAGWKAFAVHEWKLDENDEDLILRQYRIFMSQVIDRIFELLEIDFSFEISVLLTDSKRMHALNKQFRQKDKPTNVLSFPFEDDEDIDEDEEGSLYLGDVAFGYDIIEQESKDKGISFLNHFTHLIVHSTLHLLGYDHETEDDAYEMEDLEIEILSTFNIKNPYE
jgi:probable rRNA maturation factor